MTHKQASEERVCIHCKVGKALADYHKSSSNKDGYSKVCKPCALAYNRSQYRKHRESRIAKVKAWREANVETVRETTRKQYYKHHGKQPARSAVAEAVRNGDIERGNCKVCSATETQFHHTNGYDKPNYFVGDWLCVKCHAAEHVRLRELERRAA